MQAPITLVQAEPFYLLSGGVAVAGVAAAGGAGVCVVVEVLIACFCVGGQCVMITVAFLVCCCYWLLLFVMVSEDNSCFYDGWSTAIDHCKSQKQMANKKCYLYW